jgi:hypothetical protein
MRFSTSERSRVLDSSGFGVAFEATAVCCGLLAAGLLCAGLTGCGGDDERESTVEPPAGGAEADIDSEAGQLSPAGPTVAPGQPGAGPGPGLVGLVDGEPDAENPACVDEFASVTQRPPVIQFVVDTSGSMRWVAGTERLPEVGERSKWDITREALANAIDQMPDVAAVGINYYPNTPGDGPVCHVPVLAAPIERLTPEHRALIENVNTGQTPVGGTPTHAAFEFGAAELEASTLDGSRFLVLITDGIPTFTLECGGDGRARVDAAPLLSSVETHFQGAGIRTFVIGSPGSEAARDELSEMALLGGTGAAGCADLAPGSCHFDMTGLGDFGAALNAALGDITDAALGCEFEIPEPPTGRSSIDVNDVSVVVESGGTVREFSRAASAACDSGWTYSADRTTLSLCRATCDELNQLVRESPETSIRVKFGCSVTPR